ncbi:DUF3502 domain-containing protein [Anaerocolumna chitinilytica]|uniref:ABC transporter substrate-binding protein n=1 Tax=Anaerocolumna chitinilytica TaxID=1727145 RepID=A0A7I8DLQ2_9FIRM|nr:DUF3502 domain-containing protein [Anaerocolumna chitinilytica]BCJ99242.1 ABC transporter substrate-binding protein [Anaerocolumna chitinilytica]
MKRIIALLLVAVLAIGMVTGCSKTTKNNSGTTNNGAETTDGKTDNSKEVNLVLYLYGSEGVANKDILAALNEKLKASINTTLEIKYIDWGDIATKYPLMFSSGEKFDMAYVSGNGNVPYATLVKQGALADITDLLDKDAPTLKTALAKQWDSVKVDGKIYAVPTDYSEYTSYGFVSRKDLMDKYGVSTISSIADMEKYMDAAVADGQVPLNGKANLSNDLYRMFIDTTDGWINAPGISESELYLAADKDNNSKIFAPAFTDEFEAFAVKMHDWEQKGYWSKDILSSSQDDKDNFYNGLSAGYISHQPDWTGSYGTQVQKLPGVESEFYCFPEANGKIVRASGVNNATGISVNSKYPDRCLQVIEKLMTDKECYDLFQYGIEGREYELKDGKVTRPATFDEKKDGGGFASWAFRTDALNLPQLTEDPRRYTLNDAWSKVAIDNPFVGFSFDSSKVNTELSAISNVNSQLGIQILLGKTTQDPKDAVAEYRKQLKTAGIDNVLKEVNDQWTAYNASK